MIKSVTIIIVSLFTVLNACNSTEGDKKIQTQQSSKVVTQEISISNVDSLELNLCDKISVELTGLYEIIDTLKSNINESTLSGKYLVSEGFTKTTAGIGNWEKGPRMLHVNYVRDSCFCDVYEKNIITMIRTLTETIT